MSRRPAVTLIGNLAADPELRFTPTGVAMATMAVVVNIRVRNGDQWEDGPPEYHDVVAWRDLAERVAESLTKGTRVIVVGELEQRSWEDQSGQKRYKHEVKADAIGPDLRFATATVERIPRAGATDRQRPAATPAQPTPVDYDEAPFIVDVADWMPGAWGAYPSQMIGARR